MKKKLLKILIYVSILSLLLTLCSGFASAVDPVSAATMANALAQAITAYGASQGVSMTFDVASTDGIGEGVHELWNEFKEDIQDNNVPTYDSLAVTMWADIYTKVGNNIGININDTEMPYIDAFWNWLLSGPAEMTKVDNQYYEWTISDNVINPISIYHNNAISIGGFIFADLPNSPFISTKGNNTYSVTYTNNGYNVYFITYNNHNNVYFVSTDNTSGQRINVDVYYNGSYDYGASGGLYLSNANGIYVSDSWTKPSSTYTISDSDNYDSSFSPTDFMSNYLNDSTISQNNDDISVRPYVGDTTPQNIYIPDNNDVNYAPFPYVGGLDINWDDTLFGDGTGTLTDAQKELIAGTIDDDIADSIEKTLTLATDDPVPAPPANEVYIPFLPLQLPSFNFSLSGIWHYVVSWVGTLGSWFTAMFNMWSCLPYAMVVPVYATLVVVIVLGVYRRFLS